MSSIHVNRAQSANPRSIRRSSTTVQASPIIQRPTTSMDIHQSDTNVLKLPAWRTLDPSGPSGIINNDRRPKTSHTGTTTNTQLLAEQLYAGEIESLLRCLDRDDKLTVKVDCLANYRKLIQRIDLRQTPVDHKSLCALQQRENRIVQRNACRDRRFHSLLDILEPSHAIGVKRNNLHSITYNHVSEL